MVETLYQEHLAPPIYSITPPTQAITPLTLYKNGDLFLEETEGERGSELRDCRHNGGCG